MKLLMTTLTVAISSALWAQEPAVVATPEPVAVPAPATETAVVLPPEVKEEIILNNPANLQALKTLLGPELIQAAANAAQPVATGNVGAAAVPVSAAMAAGRQQVQVRPGETLDRILARALGNTPFAPALVRKTVVDMNPTAFVGGSPHRLNANATLVLPSLQDLQAVAGGGTPSASLVHSSSGMGQSHTADDRRNWIRYP